MFFIWAGGSIFAFSTALLRIWDAALQLWAALASRGGLTCSLPGFGMEGDERATPQLPDS